MRTVPCWHRHSIQQLNQSNRILQLLHLSALSRQPGLLLQLDRSLLHYLLLQYYLLLPLDLLLLWGRSDQSILCHLLRLSVQLNPLLPHYLLLPQDRSDQ